MKRRYLLYSVLIVSCLSIAADEAEQDAEDQEERIAPPSVPEHTGEWIIKDGERVCDGYLTRREDEDYCSAHVPDDWEPFLFNGKTYYVVPLSNPADE